MNEQPYPDYMFEVAAERELVNEKQKQKAKELIEELVYWAQNEEMVDQYYTRHGEVCNQAAELLKELME